MGSPSFADPSYFNGWPLDFIHLGPLDKPENLAPLIKSQEERDLLLRPAFSHVETVTMYVPLSKNYVGQDTPVDGSHITTLVGCLTPTSKGSVTLRSASIQDPPLIDVNFLDTEVDRHILREG